MIFLVVPILILVSDAQARDQIITPQGGGICVISYWENHFVPESYTYTAKESRHDYCGWRTCRKEYEVIKVGIRHVNRDVQKNRTECCSGFNKSKIHDIIHCVPVCNPECVNGVCSSPGNCSCSFGFEHITETVCGPVCKPKCVNGICTEPQNCTCIPGFIKKNSTHCVPHCPEPCINGECIGPNECGCNPGFRIHPTNHSLCEPICERECVNAECVGINQCECREGYVFDLSQCPDQTTYCNSNVCKPNCSLECINGECTEPEVCTCKEQYHLGNESWNNCLPDCNCTNGYCIEPNKCICFENYTLNEDGECEPICNNCINATCISPFTCDCLEGYKSLNSTACTPECSNCINGVCTEPEVCTCLEGYRSEEASCEPICDTGCANGICSTPNNCSCEFEYEHILENVCFPLCMNNNSEISNSSDFGTCLVKQKTSLLISSEHLNYFLKLHVPANCSVLKQLSNDSCNDIDSCKENNSSGIAIECYAVKNSLPPYNLLCIWKDNNTFFESALEEILPEVLYIGSFSTNTEKEVQVTVLLPNFTSSGAESCDICSYSSNERLHNGSNIVFEMFPCPPSLEELKNPENEGSSTLLLIILGVTALTVISLAAVAAVKLYKQKLHEYIVSRNDQYNHEEEVILRDSL